MRPFFIRMTGKQIQEIYAEEARELEIVAQICDEMAEEERKDEQPEESIMGLGYAPASNLVNFSKAEAGTYREAANDLWRFSKWIDPEAVFDLGREDLFTLRLMPSAFRQPFHVRGEVLAKLQERRRQEH